MNRRYRVKVLLEHYIQYAFGASGLKFDSDNSAEIAEIVDLIFDEIEEKGHE